MPEPVRLVIWDLDETFWNGTLTEGGMQFCQANHDIVVELARRGIMSSICSKNDHEKVKAILQECGMWDYFVFPSINWDPKGPRIAHIVEQVQLRAPTIMFVDDNPMNLNEALHFVPDLQVAPESFLPELLASPLFKGKDDSKLSRLKQYKLLEQKQEESAGFKGDNAAFLRSSNVVVTLDYDIEGNIDRVVELINRTNQLNFTKKRLPEDPERARQVLRKQLTGFNKHAALVKVRDRYGDYGYVGFYLMVGARPNARLAQYCFSCRTLNMGIETWLYRHLGRPDLEVVGEVLSDVVGDQSPIDWITVSVAQAGDAAVAESGARILSRVVAHGGCDLRAVSHYFSGVSEQVAGEFNTVRGGVPFRTDHSVFLDYAFNGMPDGAMEAFRKLGYQPEDFETALTRPAQGRSAALISLWKDADIRLWRHKTLGVTIPCYVKLEGGEEAGDEEDERAEVIEGANISVSEIREALQSEWEQVEIIGEEAFKANLATTLRGIDPSTSVFVVGVNERWFDKGRGAVRTSQNKIRLNAWTAEVVKDFPNATYCNVREFVNAEEEVHTANHFDRMVYFRIFQRIMDTLVERAAVPAAAE